MPSWSDGLCPASVRCAPVAANSGWQVTRQCSPGGKLYMRLREFVLAGAKRSNLILTGPALFWGEMVAAPSTKTALLAAAHTFVPKPVACIHESMSQISSSASKPSTNVSVAAVHARSKPPSVTHWQKCDLKEPRNHAPASGWPRTASSAPQLPLCRWRAASARRCRLPGAQNPP